jgi:hypothetical protein
MGYYLRRLWIFFNYIDLLPKGTIGERCNLFAAKAIEDPTWAFNYSYYLRNSKLKASNRFG